MSRSYAVRCLRDVPSHLLEEVPGCDLQILFGASVPHTVRFWRLPPSSEQWTPAWYWFSREQACASISIADQGAEAQPVFDKCFGDSDGALRQRDYQGGMPGPLKGSPHTLTGEERLLKAAESAFGNRPAKVAPTLRRWSWEMLSEATGAQGLKLDGLVAEHGAAMLAGLGVARGQSEQALGAQRPLLVAPTDLHLGGRIPMLRSVENTDWVAQLTPRKELLVVSLGANYGAAETGTACAGRADVVANELNSMPSAFIATRAFSSGLPGLVGSAAGPSETGSVGGLEVCAGDCFGLLEALGRAVRLPWNHILLVLAMPDKLCNDRSDSNHPCKRKTRALVTSLRREGKVDGVNLLADTMCAARAVLDGPLGDAFRSEQVLGSYSELTSVGPLATTPRERNACNRFSDVEPGQRHRDSSSRVRGLTRGIVNWFFYLDQAKLGFPLKRQDWKIMDKGRTPPQVSSAV